MYSEGMGSSVARKAIVPPVESRGAFQETNPNRRAMGRPANGSSVRELSLVEIRFAPGDDRDWLLKVMGTPETYVKLRNCRPTDGSPPGLFRLLEISCSSVRFAGLLRELRQRSDVRHVAVTPVAPARWLLQVESDLPALCQGIFEAGGTCVGCRLLSDADEDGRISWRILAPGSEPLRALYERILKERPTPSPVVHRQRYRERSSLTRRQSLALRTAFRMGYYEFPRRVGLRALAEAMGVSRSTVSEILRRAEVKVMEGLHSA